MLHLKREDLTHRGSSHHFVGEKYGDVGMSAFLFDGVEGAGPGPHRHPYDEVQFIVAGRARYVVEGIAFEAGAGDILVVKAGEVHEFKALGPERLIQVDVHLNSRFVQENLPELRG